MREEGKRSDGEGKGARREEGGVHTVDLVGVILSSHSYSD